MRGRGGLTLCGERLRDAPFALPKRFKVLHRLVDALHHEKATLMHRRRGVGGRERGETTVVLRLQGQLLGQAAHAARTSFKNSPCAVSFTLCDLVAVRNNFRSRSNIATVSPVDGNGRVESRCRDTCAIGFSNRGPPYLCDGVVIF